MFDTLTDGVHVLEGPQRFLGLELGARMTVLEVDDGILVHSPLAVPTDTFAKLGTARWVLAPNLFHHLHVGPWIEAGCEAWAAPGLPDKRADLAFRGVIGPDTQPFGPDLGVYPLRCFPFSNEVVVHHRPSRTLVVTDLVFNLAPTAPWLTRAAFWCLCGYPGCRTTALEHTMMQRRQARDDIRALLELDFDRLIMAHGMVIETGGRAALDQAFEWLRIPSATVQP